MASATAMLQQGSKLHARSTGARSNSPHQSHKGPNKGLMTCHHHALREPLMTRRSVAVPSAPRGQEADAGISASRRGLLVDGMASIAAMNGLALFAAFDAKAAGATDILDDAAGFGQLEAKKGDLALVHYTGKVKDSGEVFDTTKGDGLVYLNGGPGTFRPSIIQIGAAPSPGICAGLMQGIEGMRVGGVRTFAVPPELAFGSQKTAGPFGAIPGNSTVVYEVEVLRLSRDGPDALMKGVAKCGQGGAGAQEAGCRDIIPME